MALMHGEGGGGNRSGSDLVPPLKTEESPEKIQA
ncbi:Uncharacterised protein [Serratia quinivorans]|nr:Uncharacterised protein [Serratia quinivorans]